MKCREKENYSLFCHNVITVTCVLIKMSLVKQKYFQYQLFQISHPELEGIYCTWFPPFPLTICHLIIPYDPLQMRLSFFCSLAHKHTSTSTSLLILCRPPSQFLLLNKCSPLISSLSCVKLKCNNKAAFTWQLYLLSHLYTKHTTRHTGLHGQEAGQSKQPYVISAVFLKLWEGGAVQHQSRRHCKTLSTSAFHFSTVSDSFISQCSTYFLLPHTHT